MESKKINQLATELAPDLSDLTIIGDPTTGISKKITLSQMASLFTGTVEEYANLAAFPLVGVADTIYVALDTNVIWRWNTGTSAYVELSPNIINSLVFGDGSGFDGTISLVGSVATLTITTALTTGSVGFIGASGALLEDNTNFFWNNTTKRLGINTNVPTTVLDVFGSGIIGRINGTTTSNAFLGFASAGTNKWSIGNVQSDHRFRIYSEANSAELVSVLQTGEFGIGIANPLTKFHIFGGASALIANLDANTSVAKSISYRSGNSSRINLEVSGTESGSNAGANFFIRRYSDAGSLIDSPLTITRSTGAISLATALTGTSATFSGDLTIDTNTLFVDSTNNRVGIGTISPSTALHVAAATAPFIRIDDIGFNSENGITWQPSGFTSRGSLTLNYLTAEMRLSAGVASSTYFQTFYTAGVERMRISAGGDIGIGNSTIYNGGGFGRVLSIYETSTVAISLVTSAKQFQIGISGTNNDYRIYDFTNTTYRFAINGSTGNIGIGTTTPAGKLDVYAGANQNLIFKAESANQSSLRFNEAGNGPRLFTDAATEEFRIQQQYTGTGFLSFYTGSSERARITNGGYLKASVNATYNDITGGYHELVSNTANSYTAYISAIAASPASTYIVDIQFKNSTPNNTSARFLNCDDSTNNKAIIYSDGTYGSRTGTYGSIISDEKYKTEIQSANSQWEDIKNLRVVNFKFKEDVELEGEKALRQIGFIAQEVEKVSPNLVYTATEKDSEESWKSVKTSIIEIKAIKALQEAMEKIEVLEEKVKQLELK